MYCIDYVHKTQNTLVLRVILQKLYEGELLVVLRLAFLRLIYSKCFYIQYLPARYMDIHGIMSNLAHWALDFSAKGAAPFNREMPPS